MQQDWVQHLSINKNLATDPQLAPHYQTRPKDIHGFSKTFLGNFEVLSQ